MINLKEAPWRRPLPPPTCRPPAREWERGAHQLSNIQSISSRDPIILSLDLLRAPMLAPRWPGGTLLWMGSLPEHSKTDITWCFRVLGYTSGPIHNGILGQGPLAKNRVCRKSPNFTHSPTSVKTLYSRMKWMKYETNLLSLVWFLHNFDRYCLLDNNQHDQDE